MHYNLSKFALLTTACLVATQLHAQPWDPAMKPGTPIRSAPPAGLGVQNSSAYSGNFNNVRNTDYQRLGWQYDLFLMNTPLAWSITKGNGDVTIAVGNESFDYPSYFGVNTVAFPQHPDIAIRNFGSSVGNFYWLSEKFRYEGSPQAIYGSNDGKTIREEFGGTAMIGNNTHGFSVLSLAIAEENNQGMVGIAPKTRAVAFNVGMPDVVRGIDMDGITNGVIKVPDVLTISLGSQAEISAIKNDVQSGIVAIGAAGNAMDQYLAVTDVLSGSCAGATTYWRMTGPSLLHPAATVWDDFNTKIIAVGNVGNGLPVNSSCGIYMNGSSMVFGDNKNYSPGREKFPAPNALRATERKQLAFMDLVVPRNEITASFEYNGSTQSYNENAPHFQHGDAGTSQAVAQVGGVVALMRSVDRYLGVSLGGNGLPSNGVDVHKKAYDILTFTARKVEDTVRPLQFNRQETYQGDTVDITRVVPGHPCWNRGVLSNDYTYDASLISDNDLIDPQLQYVVQTYDNLKRTWAQRMGFGMVDAYRAVAHSIPVKANYKYQQSTTLSGGHLLNNRYFIHFGSKINESLDLVSGEDRNGGGQLNVELNVLQWGGADLPGEIHNNQGVTRIEGKNPSITITVPQNYIAAIDGIVRTADNSMSRTITTAAASGSTNDHGQILIAGMLDGVQINGRVKAGDLLINPEATLVTGLTVQNHGSTSDALSRRGSEIFGTVTLKNNAFLTVDENATLTLQPGGTIDMQGNRDVIVKDGASLIMEYPSTIKGASGRQVVVENGGKLIIKAKPSTDRLWKTELLAAVNVQNGGELIVEENALLQLGDVSTPVYVEGGGVMDCKPGSHVVIPNGRTIVCMGKFLAVGTPEHRVRISSDLTVCGEAVATAAASISTISLSGDMNKSYLDMKYCTVDNVSVWAMDMPTAPVEHCLFRTSRENTIRTMLYKSYTFKPPYVSAPAAVSDFSMLDCEFIDKKGDIDVNQWRGDDDYIVSGVVLEGLRNVTVEQSRFSYLMHSIGTRLCDNVVVIENNFFTSDFGLHDDGSAVLFCNNICDKTERGNALALSRTSRTVDNTYTNVWSSVRGQSAALQYVRNNVIKDFREGVFNDNSPFILQPQVAPAYPPVYCPSNNPLIENGYNDFISNDPDHRGSEFLNLMPGGSGERRQEQQRDISFKQDAVIGVYKGYNKLSVQSGYHLYKEEPPVATVTVGYNEWNGPSGTAVRYNQYVNPSGMPLNVQDDITRSCDVLYGCAPVINAIVCPGDVYVNDGNWTTLASTDPYLDTVYTHARQDMVNGSYDAMCRRVKAHDALEAAVLGQQKTTKLQQLITDYTAIAASGINPDGVRSLAMMLKGEVHERLGETANAVTAYTTVTTNYPTSSDAEVAAWRLRYLSASTTATVGSVAYDSAMQAYRERVLEDMRASSVGTGPHKRGDGEKAYASITFGTELKSLVPNPSDGDVTIMYSVGERSTVRLVVVDALGRELSVVSAGEHKAGEYSVKWDGRNLASGMYAVRFECGGQLYSLPLVIVK